MEVLLASKSPRRRELLGKIISDFKILDIDADETVEADLEPSDKVSAISLKKVEAAKAAVGKDSLIISADTAVFLNRRQYGKPKTRDEAVVMLGELSGNRHSVITAFTVTCGKKTVTKACETVVYFRKLTDDEIIRYVDSGEPYDKAGGYGIQGGAAKFIEKIEGDYFNVVGLPVCELTLTLKEFGLDV